MNVARPEVGADLLARPVQYLKGVGPQRAELLARLRVKTAADLIFLFPRRYQDFSSLAAIDELKPNEPASVYGQVVDVQRTTSRRGTHVTTVLIAQQSQHVRAVWFNQPYIFDRFREGQHVVLRGKPRNDEGRWEFVHPKVAWLDPAAPSPAGQILPVYPLTDGLNQYRMRQIVGQAVEELVPHLEDVFPESFRRQHNLMDIGRAIEWIHKPADLPALEAARQRLIYQELFILQTALALRRRQLAASHTAPAMPVDERIRARILRRFPFELTRSQLQVIDEMTADMAGDVPMNRLLHGEVGSGKTVVATFAILLAVAHGHQAAVMAPTELLARQHVRNLERWLANSQVRVALWTGSQSESQRRELRAEIADGRVAVVVGTQALVESPLEFARLGLVVIDEQHKFGVRQRAALRQGDRTPHCLVMTATPIPRTLAMTAFGDLDISTLPLDRPGASVVHTYVGTAATRDKWWEFFRKKLREGRQGYVIAPLVEGDEDQPRSSAEQMFEALANGELADFRLDLVHGRQHTDANAAAIESLARGETQVIVATSVIEVGIDVPNATLMTIEGAQRFGLSQLHQLRGRVARGKHPGYVCAFGDETSALAAQRLAAFAETTDGFALAELDLSLRGPGNLFGVEQHGLPPLRIANLVRDAALLESARTDAQQLVADSTALADPAWSRLRRMITARYGRALELADVG